MPALASGKDGDEVGNPITDREARNALLMSLDEAWEFCRDVVDQARTDLETGWDSSRTGYEDQLRKASEAHNEALEEAWKRYKETIGGASTPDRRALVDAARKEYNEKAQRIRDEYDNRMAIAESDYERARREAREAYVASLDETLRMHRQALDGEQFSVPTSTPDSSRQAAASTGEETSRPGDASEPHSIDLEEDADPLELAAVLAAQASGNKPGESRDGEEVTVHIDDGDDDEADILSSLTESGS